MSCLLRFFSLSKFQASRSSFSVILLVPLLAWLPCQIHADQGPDFSIKIMGGSGLRTVGSTGELYLAAPYVPILISRGNYNFNTTGQTFFLEASQRTRLRTQQNHGRLLMEWLIDEEDHVGLELGLGYLESDNECIQWCGEATEKAIQGQLFLPSADAEQLLQDWQALQVLRPKLNGRTYRTLQLQFGFNVYLNPGEFWNPYLGLTFGIGPCVSECFLSSRASPVLGMQFGTGMVRLDVRAEYGFEGFINTSGPSPAPDPLPSALVGIGIRF
ncbi:MAG: hypothetical protein CMF59_11950 [Leptospiraceae bacterium]|nr:hypothetical protein [Leptospiraceae bacterium]